MYELMQAFILPLIIKIAQGDQESKRAKFILVQYNGSSLGGMAKSRSGVHKPGELSIDSSILIGYSPDNNR